MTSAYASASGPAQALARALYIALFALRLWAAARSFRAHVASYRGRGMDFYHDVHDWLGGYPYESISSEEVDELMQRLGMVPVRSFVHQGSKRGIFGSGCNEYVYGRP